MTSKVYLSIDCPDRCRECALVSLKPGQVCSASKDMRESYLRYSGCPLKHLEDLPTDCSICNEGKLIEEHKALKQSIEKEKVENARLRELIRKVWLEVEKD